MFVEHILDTGTELQKCAVANFCMKKITKKCHFFLSRCLWDNYFDLKTYYKQTLRYKLSFETKTRSIGQILDT